MQRRPLITVTLILVTALILAGALSPSAGAAEKDSFRFVFMTDIHVMPERRGAEGFAAAIERVNEIGPDFVITGGDLIYDALETSYGRADSLYDLYIGMCESFRMPVHHTIGNHEVYGLYHGSGADPAHPEFGRAMFNQRLGGGSSSSSFDFGGWHFIMLDTIGFTGVRSYYGHVGRETLEWLARDLEKVDPGTPIVVSVHIPLVSPSILADYSFQEGIPNNLMVTNAPEVLDLFEAHDLRLVLQGHLHIVEQAQVGATKFVTGGAVSGAWWKGPYRGFKEGFLVVDVSGGELSYHYEGYGWEAAD
jgi:3',5'-cyclic AMP phosphodiesterase CpdA